MGTQHVVQLFSRARVTAELIRARRALDEAKVSWRARKLTVFIPHHRHLIDAVEDAKRFLDEKAQAHVCN